MNTNEMVSKQEYKEYLRVQKSGMFNMFDPQARQLTSLSREQWIYIIKNYEMLQETFKVENP